MFMKGEKTKLCPLSLGLAFGLTNAISILLFAWVGIMGPTVMSTLKGGIWGFVDGFLFGFVLGIIYNFCLCCGRKWCGKKD